MIVNIVCALLEQLGHCEFWGFRRQWSFKSWSSGMWCCVVPC